MRSLMEDPVETASTASLETAVPVVEKGDSLKVESYLADFLVSILVGKNSSGESQTCQPCNQELVCTDEADNKSIPDMDMEEDECDSTIGDPYSPQDSLTCQDCTSSSGRSIGCTGCGQRMCLRHAFDDGEGGNRTYKSSPGGLVCGNCIVYHYYWKTSSRLLVWNETKRQRLFLFVCMSC